jgi:L-ascorbate metabolism protein UlaG (beta-lactamase superfamily)
MKFFIFVGLFFGCSAMSFKASDHFDGDKFFNPWGENVSKTFFDVMKWKFTSKAKSWDEVASVVNPELPAASETQTIVTWVNHSTFLIRAKGLSILTDPVWSQRTSPFSFAGPARVREPGLAWDKLPKIDVVLVSHNHYDHLDLDTLQILEKRHRPVFLVPLGDGEWLKKKGLTNVQEKDWWDVTEVGAAKITFLPAQHWSARWTWDRNESLWGGWGIELNGMKIYHAGDSGLGPHFAQTRERWGAPDLALLPIGAYEPRWFMKSMHMNPSDAVEAMELLGAKQALGMHFGTFQLTDEARDQPVKDLATALKLKKITPEKFRAPQFGESFTF